MTFSIGTIEDLPVDEEGGGYQRFEYENKATGTPLLGDGSTGLFNTVYQEPLGKKKRIARVGGTTQDPDIITTLRGYYETRAPVSFIDSEGDIRVVTITDWESRREVIGRRTYSMTLIEELAP